MLAKTEASGGSGLDPQILAFTSSLELDRALLREDLVGSLAHLTMLSRRRIVPEGDARTIRDGLLRIWDAADAGSLALPDEEDVHMAVEAHLTASIGAPAGLLHTARSRNDQVCLDLHLHVREQAAESLREVALLLRDLATRADAERDLLLPSYTHRQRAQPISLAYLLCGYGAMFARDAQALLFVLDQVDVLPLGVGAIAGTSLPIDRDITRELLKFSRVSANGLDTVGNRDFALDYCYAAARSMLHVSRLSTDFVDFASPEFGFLKLAGEIACGSSMMPQKRNPDVFELLRGKTARTIGNLNGLMAMVKGLPSGYNRDLQEDRSVVLETGPSLRRALHILRFALSKVSFDRERCLQALESDYTQATDLADGLVRKGLPFRQAYKLVGALVRKCQDEKLPLSRVTLQLAQSVDPTFDADVLAAADPKASVARKSVTGSTGPSAVAEQIATLRRQADEYERRASGVPRVKALFASIREASLAPVA